MIDNAENYTYKIGQKTMPEKASLIQTNFTAVFKF